MQKFSSSLPIRSSNFNTTFIAPALFRCQPKLVHNSLDLLHWTLETTIVVCMRLAIEQHTKQRAHRTTTLEHGTRISSHCERQPRHSSHSRHSRTPSIEQANADALRRRPLRAEARSNSEADSSAASNQPCVAAPQASLYVSHKPTDSNCA